MDAHLVNVPVHPEQRGRRPQPAAASDEAGTAAPPALGDYLDFMSAFPTGVAIVTTTGSARRPYGLTCSSLASVALNPPTLLVSLRVNKGGALGVLLESGLFGVNLLHSGGRATAELMARTAPDRFARLAWGPSPRLGVPWLNDDTHAMAECRLSNTLLVGDHTIVFGEVVSAVTNDGRPLLYGLRSFTAWPGQA